MKIQRFNEKIWKNVQPFPVVHHAYQQDETQNVEKVQFAQKIKHDIEGLITWYNVADHIGNTPESDEKAILIIDDIIQELEKLKILGDANKYNL